MSHWASQPIMYFLNLKLKDPATAEAFANAHDSTSPTGATLFSWQQIRDADSKIVVNAQLVLLTGSWLLGLLAIASVAVLVGGRMAEESRRVGLLKAVGGTPSFVATVLLVENLFLALCAAAIGLVAGWLAAPLVDGPGAESPRHARSAAGHRRPRLGSSSPSRSPSLFSRPWFRRSVRRGPVRSASSTTQRERLDAERG